MGSRVAIRKLEEHCGFALFHRNVRGVELTEVGRRLLPVARDLIERSTAIGAFIEQLARGEPELFRVGYSPFLDMPFVMPNVFTITRPITRVLLSMIFPI